MSHQAFPEQVRQFQVTLSNAHAPGFWEDGTLSRDETERKGKERKGKERKGKERNGKERKGKERKGKERKGKL